MIIKSQYGNFTKEPDGRMSGVILSIKPRSDGKYSVAHCYGSGKRINKIYSQSQLEAEISKIEVTV